MKRQTLPVPFEVRSMMLAKTIRRWGRGLGTAASAALLVLPAGSDATSASRETPREAVLVYRPAPPPSIDLAAIEKRTREFETIRQAEEVLAKDRLFDPRISAFLDQGIAAAGSVPGFFGRFRFPFELPARERERVLAAASAVGQAHQLLREARSTATAYLGALDGAWTASVSGKTVRARTAIQRMQLEQRWRRADTLCNRLERDLSVRAGGFWDRVRLWGRQILGIDPARTASELQQAWAAWGAVRPSVLGAELTYVEGSIGQVSFPTTLITPSYASASSSLVLEDTTEGREIELGPALRQKASDLGNTKAAWDFVRNELRLDWYFGSLKGTTETLRSMRGNDADLAGLLIALLRAQGTPARYVRGTIEMRVLRIAGLMQLLDAAEVETVSAGGALSPERSAFLGDRVVAVLTAAGIPFEPVVGGGRVSAVRFLHTWVEAYLPYGDYRGVGAGRGARMWVPLDPSISGKAKYVASGPQVDAFASTGLSADSLASEYLGGATTGSPLELTQTRVAELVAASSPGVGYADALRTVSSRVEQLPFLPGSLPYAVPAVHAEYAFLPEDAKHRIRISARDAQGVLMDVTFPAHQLVGHRSVFAYRPATLEDEQLVALAGGLYEAPASVTKVLPVIRIDGRERATASRSVGLGAQHQWTIELLLPDGSSRRIDNRVIAGNIVALGFGAPANAMVEPQSDAVTDPEGPAGRFLYRIAATYATAWTHEEEEFASLLQILPVRPTANVVLVSNQLQVDEVLGVPRRVIWKGLEVDADHRAITPVELVSGRGTQLLRLSGYQGSWLESQVLADATGEQAVSAVTVVQEAHRRGLAVLEITPENIDGTIGNLSANADVIADIRDLVARGRRVLVPAAPMSIEGWTGTGFLARDPATEEGGYFLSGQVSGGQTVVSPQAWRDQQLVSQLERPDAPASTADLTRIARIMKNSLSDLQETVVGTPFAKPLVVYVTTADGVPVSGATVTFRTLAASQPQFMPGGGGAATEGNATVVTDGRGRAVVTAFPDPSILHWSILRRGTPYDQLVGLDVVTAEVALTDGNRLALANPFNLTAVPDVPAKVETLVPNTFYAPAQMILGAELPATVLDRFDNPLANQTVTWTQSPATGAFIEPADRLQDRVVLLDLTDWRQKVVLEQVSDTAGRVVSNYINGGAVHALSASVGAVSGLYTVQAYDPETLQYVFAYVPSERASWDGIYSTHLPEPFVFQLLRRGTVPGPAWIPIRGDEGEYSSVMVGMATSSAGNLLAPVVSVSPLEVSGLSPLDREDNALFWPSYLAEDALQELFFTADLRLANGTRDCCGGSFSFSMQSSHASLSLQRVLPGGELLDATPGGSLYFDEAIAVTVANPAAYPIYLRVVQVPTAGTNNLVEVPPPDLVPRHPNDPTLLQIAELSNTRVVLPRAAGTPEGMVHFDAYAPNPADPSNDPSLVATAAIPVSSSRPTIALAVDPETFLARRAYAAVPTADEVRIEAVFTPPMPGAYVSWSIMPGPHGTEWSQAACGTCHASPPADPVRQVVNVSQSPTVFTVVLDPGFHRSYVPGTDGRSLNPWGHGSKAASAPLSILASVTHAGSTTSRSVDQDEIDTIRQEYLNHDIANMMPARSAFAPAAASPKNYYSRSEINITAYTVMPGNPGPLADAVMDRFNYLMSRDSVIAPPGTVLPSSTSTVLDGTVDVVVDDSLGTTVRVVTTPKCYPAPQSSCDDTYRLDPVYGLPIAILAGPDRTANTTARMFPLPGVSGLAALLKPPMNSGWRNPERNEAVGGVRLSKHQFGSASDFGLPVNHGIDDRVVWCVLRRAARDQPSVSAQTETAASTNSVPCVTSGVDHVHVQSN